MKLWVGVTDDHWYEFLSRRKPDEVNFWRPSSTYNFRAIEPGGLFLFKLHSPKNFIAGGGFFVRHSVLPLSLAWEAFGKKNGAPDYNSFLKMIWKFRKDKLTDPFIGCTILAKPFFLPEEEWLPIPENFSLNLVQGKTYDTNEYFGKKLWNSVINKLKDSSADTISEGDYSSLGENKARYGSTFLTKGRLGQGAFRVMVTEAYKRMCAITRERTLPVLQSAHIKPFAADGPNTVSNGLLMRSDLHILFDRGYLTITPDHRVEVSRRIREEFENGRDYYAMHGRRLEVLPRNPIDKPGIEFVEWHNENVFIA